MSSAAEIQANLSDVRERIDRACRRVRRRPEEVTLIAVTKTLEAATVETAYRLGLRHFGENRVQEASEKIPTLSHLQPRPVWHLIGHLQSNKVKTALEIFNTIHSIDSIGLAESVHRRASGKIDILLQVNVAGESTKGGLSPNTLESAFQTISRLENLEVRGLMTIAPAVDDPEKVRPVFRRLRELRDALHLEHLSMGMTADFEVAIEEGATLVRIGRAIFGDRK